jgi:DOMON domain
VHQIFVRKLDSNKCYESLTQKPLNQLKSLKMKFFIAPVWLWSLARVKVLEVFGILIILFNHVSDIKSLPSTSSLLWENRMQLDENFLLQWNWHQELDMIDFEMQAKAHGYIGLGLSRDGSLFGSDIFISWIDDGHIFFYVSRQFFS